MLRLAICRERRASSTGTSGLRSDPNRHEPSWRHWWPEAAKMSVTQALNVKSRCRTKASPQVQRERRRSTVYSQAVVLHCGFCPTHIRIVIMKVDKVIITNFKVLRNKYAVAGVSKIRDGISKLIAADKKRGLATRLIALDDPGAMRE